MGGGSLRGTTTVAVALSTVLARRLARWAHRGGPGLDRTDAIALKRSHSEGHA